MTAFLHLAGFLLLSIQTQPAQVPDLLRARDQELLDAIATGNRTMWDEALAAYAQYVDENGTVISREEFLKQIEPLPTGVSGKLQIVSYSARVQGDIALVIHTDDEEEVFHGQTLHAQYLTTETWLRESAGWKLALAHVYAVLKDPPAVSLPAAEMEQYAGRYQAADDLSYVIAWDGEELTGGREGRVLKPLKVEIHDVLFAPGQPRIRKVFQRDAAGRITGFVDRRESWDLSWRRVEQK